MSGKNNVGARNEALVELANLLPLVAQADQRALAKAASIVEDGEISIEDLRAITESYSVKRTHLLGITGSPGVGKSTTTNALVTCYRKKNLSVGIIAIDPSSPITGGALLGDRIRLATHFSDKKVFIRSLATRGALGGLSRATDSVAHLLAVAGFDRIIIETVGVGQSEIDVMRHADTVLLLLAPGLGDGIQAAKAGVMEIGDIYFINKSDRGGAQDVAREVERSLSLSSKDPGWNPPVLIGAMESELGIAELVEAIDSHINYRK